MCSSTGWGPGLLGLIAAGIAYWLLRIHDPGELHLNLGLSCMAAVQGVVLQIAANRGDRINAEVALHIQSNTDDLMRVNARQLEILGRLDGLTDQVSGLAEAVRVAMAARDAVPRPRARKAPGNTTKAAP